MRRLAALGGALVLMLGGVITTHADVAPLAQPESVGAQLIFYYDTREGFTTFANISQLEIDDRGPVTVQIDFWGPTFETKISQTITLGVREQRVIDVGALKATNGLGAQQGIAIASVINEFSNPIALPVLTGSFTVANLATGSAWGAPAAARSARVAADGSAVSFDMVVDGTSIVYQSIQAPRLILANYYDPQTLAPASANGRQVIFINFKNAAGSGGSPITSASTAWGVRAVRADGQLISDTVITVSGVTEFDLVSLIGDGANGAAGGVSFFTLDQDLGESRLVFFAQSLGTFGTGYLLPLLNR